MSGGDPDPIFAAIERHREAHASFTEQCRLEGTAKARKRAYRAADAAEARALRELLATTPLTSGGARAAMKYLVAFDAADSCRPAVAGKFCPALMNSALLAA
jgi:hypothetical protein